jgi:hypothetical protein
MYFGVKGVEEDNDDVGEVEEDEAETELLLHFFLQTLFHLGYKPIL